MAYIPYRRDAVIDPAKIRWLLTGEDHSAQFARFGLTEEDDDWLETTLLEMVYNSEYVSDPIVREHGTLYTLYETVMTPTGRRLRLLSGWMVRHGEHFPRLTTAYPRRRPYKGKEL